MRLHSVHANTYDDNLGTVLSFFLVDDDYLYCINYYKIVRPLDGRFDNSASGWKVKTESVENTIKSCPTRGVGYVKHTLNRKEAKMEWKILQKLIEGYFSSTEYIDGWFDIMNDNNDPNGMQIDEFRKFISS